MKSLTAWLTERRNRKIRIKACELAALSVRKLNANSPYSPTIWSLTVFFESYIHHGAEGTQDDFGAKDGAVLRLVSKGAPATPDP